MTAAEKKKKEDDNGAGSDGRKADKDTAGKAKEGNGAAGHPWESDLQEYPLRRPEKDPGWAVKIVTAWIWIAGLSGIFILALIILGFFYD